MGNTYRESHYRSAGSHLSKVGMMRRNGRYHIFLSRDYTILQLCNYRHHLQDSVSPERKMMQGIVEWTKGVSRNTWILATGRVGWYHIAHVKSSPSEIKTCYWIGVKEECALHLSCSYIHPMVGYYDLWILKYVTLVEHTRRLSSSEEDVS